MPTSKPSSAPVPLSANEIQPVADLSKAPLPTAATLRRRKSVVYQLGRFISFSLSILRMTAKGHK